MTIQSRVLFENVDLEHCAGNDIILLNSYNVADTVESALDQ